MKPRDLLAKRTRGSSKRRNTPPGGFKSGVPLREGSKRGLAQGDEYVVFDIVEKPVAIPKDYDPHADAVAEAPPADLIKPSLS